MGVGASCDGVMSGLLPLNPFVLCCHSNIVDGVDSISKLVSMETAVARDTLVWPSQLCWQRGELRAGAEWNEMTIIVGSRRRVSSP
eukprot:scaffold5966_cov118-Cylindrotheca_fusiformis.AAC.25